MANLSNFFLYLWYFLIDPRVMQVYIFVSFAGLTLIWVHRFYHRHKYHSLYRDQLDPVHFLDRYFYHLHLLFLVVILFSIAGIIIPSPLVISPKSPLFDPLEVSYAHPLVLEFDRPFGPGIDVSLTPVTPGTWKYGTGKFGPLISDRLIFTPLESMSANSEYTVSLTNISPLSPAAPAQNGKHLFVFSIPPLPEVKTIEPADLSRNVKTDSGIVVDFDNSISDNVILEFKLEPFIDLAVTYNDARTQAVVMPVVNLDQNTIYKFSIDRYPVVYSYQNKSVIKKSAPQTIFQSSFATVESANIKNVSPQGTSVLPDTPLVVQFKEPMDNQSVQNALKITPNTPGIYSWPQEDRLEFFPENKWLINTSYRIDLAKSAKSLAGGTLSGEFSHSFTTIGPLKVLNSTPPDKTQAVSVSSVITLTFDQPPNQDSVANNLTLSPFVPGNISWDEHKIIYSPSTPLEKNTRYTVRLKSGTESLYGQSQASEYTFSFQTIPNTFELKVPLAKQHYTFTCYSAASQMALGFYGIAIDEVGFLNEIGFDTTGRSYARNVWGNPNVGIVGTYDGSGSGGYGVHVDPVAKAIGKYRPVEVKHNWTIPELLAQVQKGHPVMVWWVNGVWPARDVSWYLPSGEKVYAVNGLHVEVVTGFTGDPDNPSVILTNDPWRGKRQYSPQTFSDLWRWFSNTALIVY